MIIRPYRALDPEGTEVQLFTLEKHKPGDIVEGLNGTMFKILENKEA